MPSSHAVLLSSFRFSFPLPTTVRAVQVIIGSVAIYAAVYLRDILGNVLSGSLSMLLLFAGTAVLIVVRGVRFSHFELTILFCFVALTLINTSMSSAIAFSNYLIAPVIAFFISRSARSFFVRLMLLHAVISLAIQLYEHSTGTYLFSVTAEDGSLLNSVFFSGQAGVMRAKGLFQGPLSAVAFYILVALVSGKTKAIIIAVGGALLAYGRLGIIITTSMLAFRMMASTRAFYRFGALPLSAVFLIVAPEFIKLPNFFSEAFNITSSGNLARIYFWLESISHFLNYPGINMVFGDLGYANRVIGSTESDFLRISMDSGLATLSLYLGLMIAALRKATRRASENLFHFFLIFLAMSLFPFIQSLNATILFWVYIWDFLKSKRASDHA